MRILLPVHTKEHLEQRPIIYQFQDEHRYLSNFWPCNVILPAEGNLPAMSFEYLENAYMAAKTLDQSARLAMQKMKPGKAKLFSYSSDFIHRPNYSDAFRLEIMQNLVMQKFSAHNPELLRKLLDTKNDLIIEGNVHCDTFFGFDLDNGYGQNNLGRILMATRQTRRQELVY